ncbi:MAG: hypothetical protein JWN62_2618, partial [Acidimicrobiales bacterium]|nr:hypothetical protein [Acidimicrobiales bacterium]
TRMRAAARTSTRAEPLTASGQNCWPPTGSFVTAYGQDLMAADIRGAGRTQSLARAYRCQLSQIGVTDRDESCRSVIVVDRSPASLTLARFAARLDGGRAGISMFYSYFLRMLDDFCVDGLLESPHLELCFLLERWEARPAMCDVDLIEKIRYLTLA